MKLSAFIDLFVNSLCRNICLNYRYQKNIQSKPPLYFNLFARDIGQFLAAIANPEYPYRFVNILLPTLEQISTDNKIKTIMSQVFVNAEKKYPFNEVTHGMFQTSVFIITFKLLEILRVSCISDSNEYTVHNKEALINLVIFQSDLLFSLFLKRDIYFGSLDKSSDIFCQEVNVIQKFFKESQKFLSVNPKTSLSSGKIFLKYKMAIFSALVEAFHLDLIDFGNLETKLSHYDSSFLNLVNFNSLF